MKQKLTIVFALLMLFAAQHSYAAFPAQAPKPVVTEAVTHKTFSERKVPQFIHHVFAPLLPDHVKKDGGGDKSGWQGIVALICGVVGIFAAPLLFSTAAIVFGILGVDAKKHKYTGMAIAGLILGGIGLIYAIAVLMK